jgi:hypothetical protein
MAGEIGVAKVSVNMLKALWAAQQSGGAAAVAAEVTNIAAQLGVSTQAVWNGVIAAQASSNAAVAGWAGTVAEGVASAELGLSGQVVATASRATPGLVARVGATIVEWWAGATVVTQAVIIGGILIVLVAGGGWVAGWWSEDPETAATAVELTTTSSEAGESDDDSTDSDVPSGAELIEYRGTVTLVPGALTVCSNRDDVDGSFDLEVLEDGSPLDGDFEIGGNVVVGSAGAADATDPCETDEITCRLEFLTVVRVRGGGIKYEHTAGRVFGPGYEGSACDRADYVEQDEASGPASITFDAPPGKRMRGTVLFEGFPYLEFSGSRRGG